MDLYGRVESLGSSFYPFCAPKGKNLVYNACTKKSQGGGGATTIGVIDTISHCHLGFDRCILSPNEAEHELLDFVCKLYIVKSDLII